MQPSFGEEPASTSEDTTPKHTGLLTAFGWVRDLAFSVLIAIVLIVFIYQPVKVEGTSLMLDLQIRSASSLISSPIGSESAALSGAISWSFGFH